MVKIAKEVNIEIVKLDKLNDEQIKCFEKLGANKSKKIRYLRNILNWTRSEVANYLNIRYQFVRNVELITGDKEIDVIKELIK